MNQITARITQIMFGLVPVLTTGCVQIFDYTGQIALTGDVYEIFERFEVNSDDISCRPVSGHRMGFCSFTPSSEEVDRLVRELALEPEDVYNPVSFPERSERSEPIPRSVVLKITGLRGEISELEMGCMTLEPFEERTSVEAYGSYGQDASIRELNLSGGSRFESLFLLYNVETGEACLQAGYGYG